MVVAHAPCGKTGQTGFATSHIPVTSVVIPTEPKSRGQRCGKTGQTGFATTTGDELSRGRDNYVKIV